jgi:phosphonate transport system substrate-binding protein
MKRITSQRNHAFKAVVVVLFFLLQPCDSSAEEKSLTLQIYPYAPADKVVKQFTPLATYLKAKLKRPVTIHISKDTNEHMEIVGNDKADISFLGPVSYVQVVEKYGKKNIIACLEIKGSHLLQGVIFTPTSSPVLSLKELKGKRFAFGYPNSTMSHLVPLSMLEQEGVHINDFSKHTFLSDQYNVALGVLMGDFDAGAVNAGVFMKYKSRGLKALAWTPKVSEHLFVARPSLPNETVESLKSALFDVRNISNGNTIMNSIRNGMTGFVPVQNSDYDNLRVLLQELGKTKPTP